ncbi:hypothetical protein [Halocatena halophila]|uniref:hypothetical protein n=1 Tax=Halocatena halophila TaxID=2814576 RepID=UPI002ED32EBF
MGKSMSGITEESGTEFAIGDVVHDRDHDDPNDGVVVNLPNEPAEEWVARVGSYQKKTVADDNPDYPSDAAVVSVVFADDLEETFPEWKGEEPLSLKEIDKSGIKHYSFPAPRLQIVESIAKDEDGSKSEENEGTDSIQELVEHLENRGMDVKVEDDERTVQASKLGETYRISDNEVIEGDGALRSRLESVITEISHN